MMLHLRHKLGSGTWCCWRWLLCNSSLSTHVAVRSLPSLSSRGYLATDVQPGCRLSSGASPGPVVQQLKDRGLLRVAGKDATTFLQGLVTNDVEALEVKGGAMYTMMLNVQGRVVYDMMLYNVTGDADSQNKASPAYFVECDACQIGELHSTMAKYRIRKKVDITLVSDSISVWTAMPHNLPASNEDLLPLMEVDQSGSIICVPDPRLSALGLRLLLPCNLSAVSVISGAVEATSPDFYTIRRYHLGIGEGPGDLPPGNALPLECNAVFLNGVSFDKGCYIGQELTARSHHTGVIRKRLMPIKFTRDDHSSVAGNTVENTSGKNCGKLRNYVGQLGLALLRVAEVLGSSKTLPVVDAEKKVVGELETGVPFWWPRDSDPVVKQALDQQTPGHVTKS